MSVSIITYCIQVYFSNCQGCPSIKGSNCLYLATDTGDAVLREKHPIELLMTRISSVRVAAIKATFKSGEGIAGGPFILTIHVDEVLKRGKVQISETDLTLWTERDCICPRFKVGRTYLILGYEDSTNKRLLFDSRSVALRWRKIWARKIRVSVHGSVSLWSTDCR